jgi:hypothetical protein
MTIRAKLYAAIVLTVLGPLVTIAVALHGQGELGDAFEEVRDRAQLEALARELKFGVTDVNGWQTAYGYDGGRSRPEFERAVAAFRSDLARADRTLTDSRERALLLDLRRQFESFMELDAIAYRALRNGREARTEQIFLGPEIDRFRAMAATGEDLAVYESRRAALTELAFDEEREDARRRLIAVALCAGLVIVLLLVTAADIARLAIEGHRVRE